MNACYGRVILYPLDFAQPSFPPLVAGEIKYAPRLTTEVNGKKMKWAAVVATPQPLYDDMLHLKAQGGQRRTGR